LETVRTVAAEVEPKGIVGRNVLDGSSVNRQNVAADFFGVVVKGSVPKPGDCGVKTSAEYQQVRVVLGNPIDQRLYLLF
jgi:hypothetical protein